MSEPSARCTITVASAAEGRPGRDRGDRARRADGERVDAPLGSPLPSAPFALVRSTTGTWYHRGDRPGRRPGDADAVALPKVLHPLAGRPMVEHVLAALARAGIEHRVSSPAPAGRRSRPRSTALAATVRQDPQLGHRRRRPAASTASRRRAPRPRHDGRRAAPPAELFSALAAAQAEAEAAMALLAARVADPTATAASCAGPTARGRDRRAARGGSGDARDRRGQRRHLLLRCRVAAGTSATSRPPRSGEYYLTDLVAMAVGAGRRVGWSTRRARS